VARNREPRSRSLYFNINKRWAPKKKWKHIHSLDFHSKITMTLQLKKSDLKFETALQEAKSFRGKGEPSGTPDHTPVRVVLFCRTRWALLHLCSELPTSL
jgi:hypothetical protein